MNRELETTNTVSSSGTRSEPGVDALTIKVKVRELPQDPSICNANNASSRTTSQSLVRFLVLVGVLGISGIYAGLHIGKGWVPADDGTLAQSALRVLEGQLPHRDFAEIYTGGLSFIHALAFQAFGVNLMSLRICVFLFFLAWLPAVYYIALRFTSALGAGLVTLLAVAWSYPNYPAAMPSWYNLFCATYGALALLHYLEVRKARWLFVAGVCGGLSVLIKVIGAYYIAGVLLFLASLEHGEHEPSGIERQSLSYRVFSAGALVAFLAVVIYLFRGRLGGGELYQFVVPACTLAGAILIADNRVQGIGAGARFRVLFRLVTPFVAGVTAPLLVFLIPYARSGTLGAFVSGVTGSAVAHMVGLGVIRPVGAGMSAYGLALLGLVAAAMFRREFQSKLVAAAIAIALGAMLCISTRSVISGVWFSVATLTPLVVLSGVAVVLGSRMSDRITTLQRQRVMLLISLAGLCSYVQFPFAAPIYLSYCLPLTLLAAVAIVTTVKRERGTFVLASVMGFYLLFGAVRVVPGYIYELTHMVGRLDELRVNRAGGLRIESAANLEELIHFLQQHSDNGLLYAANDCPAFYFLSGLKNVTRGDGGAPAKEVLRALQSSDVKVVLINEEPFFPGAEMSPEVRAEVMREFPESKLVGIPRMGLYRVFWRQ